MIIGIVVLWMLVRIYAPLWCYILLGISMTINIGKTSIKLYKLLEEPHDET